MAEQPGQRLGRGLAALLGGSEPAGATPPPESAKLDDLQGLYVSAIRPNPRQPRRRFDEEALEALAESIRTSGLVQPVVVRPVTDGYELIAGERRWQAARRAGLERIPALVRDAGERERLELALVENVVREDLNPIELARAVAALVEDFGQTHAQVAGLLGRSRPAITNLLRLQELPESVAQMLEDGRLSEGHGRAILGADGTRARRELAERAVAEGLSVRQTEALASGQARRRRPRPQLEPSPVVDAAVDRLYGLLGAPVRVRSGRRGAVVVELVFADEEALRRALERMP